MNYWIMPGISQCYSKCKTVKELAQRLCEKYNIEYSELLKKSRQSRIVELRRKIYYIAYKRRLDSLGNIGVIFGHDHATVLHHSRVCKNYIETNPEYKKEIQILENQL